MLKTNLTINGSRNFTNLLMEEKTPILKLNLRGKINNNDFISNVGKILGVILPVQVGSIVTKGYLSIITTGPNEWIIISNSKENINLIKILHKINHQEIRMEIYQIILECNKGVHLVGKMSKRLEVV